MTASRRAHFNESVLPFISPIKLDVSKISRPVFKKSFELIGLALIAIVLFWNIYLVNNVSFSKYATEVQTTQIKTDYSHAFRDSGGFFTDVTNDYWNHVRQRVENAQYKCFHQCHHDEWLNILEDWIPIFTCLYEQRVGGLGDGGKWICDPHRIKDQVKKSDCLIYSVGSNGDFTFEESLNELTSEKCEIHTFDPGNYTHVAPKYVNYHEWGYRNAAGNASRPTGYFKTFQETITELGHVGKKIDIFKIDCEGCEFDTYKDWFSSDLNLNIRQILVEIHKNSPFTANNFFVYLRNAGYVMFHKEANPYDLNVYEIAFIKLEDSFFQGMKRLG